MPPGRNSGPGRNFGMWPQNGPGMRNQQQVRGGPFSGRPPMQHQPAAGGGTQQKGVGGLISKILGKSKQQSPPPSSYFSRPSAPVEPIKSTASLTSVLANTQKVLSAAEQIGPMVHQYGPIIKNLPAMWKMYRSMKDTENTEEAEDENTETTEEKLAEPVETEVKTVVKEEKSSHLEIKDEQIVPKTKKRERISQPKLYI